MWCMDSLLWKDLLNLEGAFLTVLVFVSPLPVVLIMEVPQVLEKKILELQKKDKKQ